MTDLLVGTAIAGRYEVLELVGEGGMGAVYRVIDRELDEVVALKVIRGDLAQTAGIVDRFRTEVKLARRVTHGNVARTYELGHVGDLLFCTMELVAGEPLSRRLRRGALPVGEAVAIACAVGEGLAAAHAAGVIHRDIKPDNILVGARVVVTDFGVAALVADQGEVAGTPAYMAPEQTRGEAPTPAVDVYALGVVLYEMVTGTRAFKGDEHAIYEAKRALGHLAVARADVPEGVAEAIARATAREASRRIATAGELVAALAPWRPDAPLADEPRTPVLHGLATVVVSAPEGDEARLYIAESVHRELLSRLARTPKLRVSVEDSSQAALRVELRAGDALAVTVSGRHDYAMRLPLDVPHVRAAAESIAAAIVGLLAPPERSHEASELLLQAVHIAQGRFRRYAAGIETLERALALAPADPQIAAMLALGLLGRTFFIEGGAQPLLARARELVAIALAHGPGLYETHLAAGQLELNDGEPATAAGHFRVAIRCAPHAAMAHEQLGRMLLEAKHLDAAFARIAEAMALAPHLRTLHWPLARAFALEGRWADYQRTFAEMGDDGDFVARVRIALWTRDVAAANELRARPPVAPIYGEVFATMCDGAWHSVRASMLARAEEPTATARTCAFRHQVAAECAALAGDHATALHSIARATERGLYDLHWLDRCPLLAALHMRPEWLAVRAPIAARADAIFDALYGDHAVAAPDRTRVERPAWLDGTTRMR